MVQECPKCRLINPPTAVLCDCGYEFATGRVVRQGAPRRTLNFFHTWFILRLGLVMALAGVVALLLDPYGWGWVKGFGIVVAAGGLIGFAIWRSNQ